jgi:hypothetical protein
MRWTARRIGSERMNDYETNFEFLAIVWLDSKGKFE